MEATQGALSVFEASGCGAGGFVSAGAGGGRGKEGRVGVEVSILGIFWKEAMWFYKGWWDLGDSLEGNHVAVGQK